MVQEFREGRELWAAQGNPYYDPDIVSGTRRTITYIGKFQPRFGVVASSTLIHSAAIAAQQASFSLRATAAKRTTGASRLAPLARLSASATVLGS